MDLSVLPVSIPGTTVNTDCDHPCGCTHAPEETLGAIILAPAPAWSAAHADPACSRCLQTATEIPQEAAMWECFAKCVRAIQKGGKPETHWPEIALITQKASEHQMSCRVIPAPSMSGATSAARDAPTAEALGTPFAATVPAWQDLQMFSQQSVIFIDCPAAPIAGCLCN